MKKETLINRSPEGNTKQKNMGTLRPFELDPFDLLWRDLFENNSRFSAITQKVTHPVDIYETPEGIKFEVAAVGLDSKDIDIQIDGDQLRIMRGCQCCFTKFIICKMYVGNDRTICRVINRCRGTSLYPLSINV